LTKIRKTGSSSMIEDRRGQGGGGGGSFPFPMGGGGGGGGLGVPIKAGGGLLGLLVVLAMAILPKLMGGGTSAGSNVDVSSAGLTPSGETASGGGSCDTEIAQIVCGGVEDVQVFWEKTFAASGKEYTPANTVFFSGSTSTGCGEGSAQMGPFYCPNDQKVYFDLDFLEQLQAEFGAQGDLAAQYIVAHEYGHHVQNVLGISDQVHQAQQRYPSQANAYSVKLELQADCLAGVWAHDANARGEFDSANEVDEALNAAAAVGDDTIQKRTMGRVDTDSFTHGSSEQRVTWFRKGYSSGTSDSCDTFAE
jgi:predicted metalloprotease